MTTPQVRFVSLRWRLITPFYLVILIVAMAGAYVLARNISGGLQVSQQNFLLQSSRSVDGRSEELFNFHRNEAQRIAFTRGAAAGTADSDRAFFEDNMPALLRVSGLDMLMFVDRSGREIYGLAGSGNRGEPASSDTARINSDLFSSLWDGDATVISRFVQTPAGLMLFTAVPVFADDRVVGAAAVGQRLESVIVDLRRSSVADLGLFSLEGDLLQASFDQGVNRDALAITSELMVQVLADDQQVPIQPLVLNNVPYNAAYRTFDFGGESLGLVGVYAPDDIPFISETGRQLTAVGAAIFAGTAITLAYAGMSYVSGRAGKVARVAEGLATGQRELRTGLAPTDEINAVGSALDKYADSVQEREDELQQALRRQRREINHLLLVFESIPYGVVVQDLDGRVVVINDEARELLGSQELFRSTGLQNLVDSVGDKLGSELLPGLYALGDPRRVDLGEKILSAQAAAVLSATNQRIGTVVMLRDITGEVVKERERDAMLERLAAEIQGPLALLGRAGSTHNSSLLQVFAKEIARQSVALQKMIMDMRELATIDLLSLQRRQRPLSVDTLVWALANEWRQVAVASGLKLHVMIEKRGQFILGDEKRLRWALGNLVDNAIKYTLPGGALMLEVKTEEDGRAVLRVRDNGVGVLEEDREHIFTRFYRGKPVTQDGQLIRVPGMGQGLYIARQIIEAHGGAIRMKSSPRQGTAVYIYLPLTSPVGMQLSPMWMDIDMDGETQQLPEQMLVDIDDKRAQDK